MSSPATIATQIVNAIEAISIPNVPITHAKKIEIWTAVVTQIYTDLQSNAIVAVGTFAVPSGPSAGPIVGQGGPLS